jgi:DNA-binding MarR family transcriptional regulator
MDENTFKILDLISEKPIVLNSEISDLLGIGWNDFLKVIDILEKHEYIFENRNIDNEYSISKIGTMKLNELKSKIDKEKSYSTVFNNHFSGSTIGQINQSSEKIAFNSPIKQTTTRTTPNEPNKKSMIEILYWIIGIAVGISLIYEFILKRFID